MDLAKKPLRGQMMSAWASITSSRCVSFRLFGILAALAVMAIHAPAVRAQANVQGTWQTLPNLMPINPVHTALMHNGKIIVVSGSGNFPAQTTFLVGIWDPSTNTFGNQQTMTWDMFCNGMIVLPDGRPLVMGGNLQYDPFFGWTRTSVL